MNATFLDEAGTARKLVMGCYGIGISRVLAALIEQHHDQHGITLPLAVAPFQVLLVQLGSEPAVTAAVERLESELEALGLEVLVDDRDERPGVKFKDADLLGIPLRLTLGKKALESGAVELKLRSDPDPKASKLLELGRAAAEILQLVQQALRRPTTSEAA